MQLIVHQVIYRGARTLRSLDQWYTQIIRSMEHSDHYINGALRSLDQWNTQIIINGTQVIYRGVLYYV